MTVMQIKTIAKDLGINPGKMTKPNIIKKIQTKEGNFPCFKTAINYCDQNKCLWQKDCLK